MLNLLGVSLHLYGLLIGLGIMAATEASEWLARKRNIHIPNFLALSVIISGIIGARIYHVIDLWSRYYSVQPIKVFYLWEGGLAIWGAIIGGVMALLIYWLRSRKTTKLMDLLDIVFIGVPLGQAIGRWGNYFNGELLGKNSEPLFLYESLLDLLLFAVLIRLAKSHAGKIVGTYLIGYGLIRFILEPMRSEQNIWRIGEIPTAQIFSALAIILGMMILIKIIPSSKDT